MNYLKHFGENSAEYLKFRPDYPKELYQYLANLCETHELAWDVGTGNGQAAVQIAEYFQQVVATDINQPQLDVALQKDNIIYQNRPAEHSHLKEKSVDLITIAQAIHWFNLEEFYKEVKRVGKSTSIIAAWAYSLCYATKEIDILVQKLYKEILKDYWPKERQYIDEQYRYIPFPFNKIIPPNFEIDKHYTLQNFIGYLHTWSAVKEYQKINHQNPIEFILEALIKVWGDPEQTVLVHWPIHMLVAKVF